MYEEVYKVVYDRLVALGATHEEADFGAGNAARSAREHYWSASNRIDARKAGKPVVHI